jgi:hypothetical protein
LDNLWSHSDKLEGVVSDFGRGSGKFQYTVKYLGIPLYIPIPPTSIFFHAFLSTCPEVAKLYKSRAAPAQSGISAYYALSGSINYQNFL